MDMATRIKERRLAMDFTQEELASRLGLQKSAIAKYENGRVENIKRSVIQKMASILECTPSYLMGWEDFENEVAAGNVEPDKIKKALKLYDLYAHSKPKVQSMVDYLLEEGASDSAVVIESTPRD